MMVLALTPRMREQGFKCVCGQAISPTALYRLTCPACRQVYQVEASPPAKVVQA